MNPKRRLASLVGAAAARIRQDPDLGLAIILALAARLIFWLVTNRVWEDALITTIHARNAVAGLGLIHHVGEANPVQGFTSAVSVLIPLVADFLVRDSDLFVMPVISLVAVAVALLYARRLTRLLGLSRWPTLLVLLYLALDQNQIFYGMAGMETQIAVAVLLAGFYHVMSANPRRAGLLIGLSILVRPDFLIWAGCALGGLAIIVRRKALIAGLLALVIVAPWIAFTTWYYGSPIPHTIAAKSIAFISYPDPGAGLPAWVGWAGQQFTDHLSTILRSFEPFFENTFVQAAPIPAIGALICALAMFLLAGIGLVTGARQRALWPLAAFLLLETAYRIFLLPIWYSDWYVPPFTATAILFVGLGLERLRSSGSIRRTIAPVFKLSALVSLAVALIVSVFEGPVFGLEVFILELALTAAGILFAQIGIKANRLLTLTLIIAFAIHFPFTLELEAKVQHDIEDSVRVPVGIWLRDHVPAGEPVIAESAGYFEFYSGVTMYDYPGLTSDVSLAALRSLPPEKRNLAGLIDKLRSPWLVLRPTEWADLMSEYPATAAQYHVVVDIHGPDVSDVVDAHGLVLQTVDRRFLVLRHN
jgi:hypothetical protein